MNYINEAEKLLSLKIDVETELLDLYTLLVLVKGENTTLEDVHNAWSVWMNRIKTDHHSLIAFKDLSEQVKEYDREYAEAIVETAEELKN